MLFGYVFKKEQCINYTNTEIKKNNNNKTKKQK